MTMNPVLAPRREASRSDLLERRLRRYHPRFREAVVELAMRHSRVADLAVSFPALLFALAVPRRGLDPTFALECVIQGRSLAEVAAAADVPMWLRKLPPEALARPLTRLPDGELFRRQIANHFPLSPKRAPSWLEAVADLADLAHESAAVWIAREIVRLPRRRMSPARLRLIGLWIWFSCRSGTFGHELIDKPWTPDMRFGQVLAAALDWRTSIELYVNAGRQPIADMWLQAGRVDGYDFLPLGSTAAIANEARAMRNCLRTYGYSLAHNYSRLWSIQRDGERVATLEVASHQPLPNIVEIKGPGNVDAPRELWLTARQWLNTHDLSQINVERRKWDTVKLDRSTWLSLWRPYWLEKRRIPEWLPVAPSREVLEALQAT
jgi:hypothetical protein